MRQGIVEGKREQFDICRTAGKLPVVKNGKMDMHVKLVSLLVLASLVVLFIVQNAAAAEVRFLFWSLSMSLSLFVFLLFAIGVVVGWLAHSYSLYRRKAEKNKLNAV
jgi:uncharacterized integral membrane protein